MVKVITYGTYDLLHYGHIRLLERAKALGDYLIVGVTSDDFDKTRGKINVQQSLEERIEAVRQTGLADKIIVEEYEGQKIDDIKKYGIDIFTVGSDWKGKFDYLKEYCQVVYLPRTEGVSSSEIRSHERNTRIGLVGESLVLRKYYQECNYVNGLEVSAVYTEDSKVRNDYNEVIFDSYDDLLNAVDAVYIVSHPSRHYEQIKKALLLKKHVLCESPISMTYQRTQELFQISDDNNVILMEAIKTAYSTAYNRLLLLLKGGKIGRVLSVDATCTSLSDAGIINETMIDHTWDSMSAWGPTAVLPIFQILGTEYKKMETASLTLDEDSRFDLFTKADFLYPNAVASFKVGKGAKSEGELIVTGTEGYAYVPAPWWKTDYFEIRYENPADNRRYFYQLDGEGIRYELVAFLKSIKSGASETYISKQISLAISKLIENHRNQYETIGMEKLNDWKSKSH